MPTDEIRFYAEYHSKINSITLSIKVPPTGLTCTVGPRAVDLIPSNHATTDDQENALKVPLPAVVMPTRTTQDPSTAKSSLLTLKLTALPSAQPSSSLSASEFPPPPLLAAQLQGLENLGCGCCKNTLLKRNSDQNEGGPIQRVVDLPSEHWQELVDCWMCHEEDFTELREGDLGARIGQALVGGTYILIHSANVNGSSVAIEEDAPAVDVSSPE